MEIIIAYALSKVVLTVFYILFTRLKSDKQEEKCISRSKNGYNIYVLYVKLIFNNIRWYPL